MTHGLWAKVYGSIFDHPKTVAVARRLADLGVPICHARDVAVGQWVRLVCWARASRTDGRIDLLDPADFARVLRSDLDPEVLREIWLSSGFVDGRQTLHEFGPSTASHASTHDRARAPERTIAHASVMHALGGEESRRDNTPLPPSIEGGRVVPSSTVPRPNAAALEVSPLVELYRRWSAIRDSKRLPWSPFDRLDRSERKTFDRLLVLCRGDLDLATKALRRFHGLNDRWVEQRGFDLVALKSRVDLLVSLVTPAPVLPTTIEPVRQDSEPLAEPGRGAKIIENFIRRKQQKVKK